MSFVEDVVGFIVSPDFMVGGAMIKGQLNQRGGGGDWKIFDIVD
jgi:hypothetical protein